MNPTIFDKESVQTKADKAFFRYISIIGMKTTFNEVCKSSFKSMEQNNTNMLSNTFSSRDGGCFESIDNSFATNKTKEDFIHIVSKLDNKVFDMADTAKCTWMDIAKFTSEWELSRIQLVMAYTHIVTNKLKGKEPENNFDCDMSSAILFVCNNMKEAEPEDLLIAHFLIFKKSWYFLYDMSKSIYNESSEMVRDGYNQ